MNLHINYKLQERAILFSETIASMKSELIKALKQYASSEKGIQDDVIFEDAGIFFNKVDGFDMILSFNAEGIIDVGTSSLSNTLEQLSVDTLSSIYSQITKDGRSWIQLVSENDEKFKNED